MREVAERVQNCVTLVVCFDTLKLRIKMDEFLMRFGNVLYNRYVKTFLQNGYMELF